MENVSRFGTRLATWEHDALNYIRGLKLLYETNQYNKRKKYLNVFLHDKVKEAVEVLKEVRKLSQEYGPEHLVSTIGEFDSEWQLWHRSNRIRMFLRVHNTSEYLKTVQDLTTASMNRDKATKHLVCYLAALGGWEKKDDTARQSV